MRSGRPCPCITARQRAQRTGPAVDPAVFPDTAGWYWSSTPYVRTGGFWLAQSSGDGVMYPNMQSDGAAVRCVR